MTTPVGQISPLRIDLHKVLKGHVCLPDSHGRTSLKCVLPALVEDLSCEGPAVPNGEVAMLRHDEAVWGDLGESEPDPRFAR